MVWFKISGDRVQANPSESSCKAVQQQRPYTAAGLGVRRAHHNQRPPVVGKGG